MFALLLAWTSGKEEAIKTADSFGGLWIVLLVVISAFAEAFYMLSGHRLEINQDVLCLKTLFSTTWAIPITSITRIDPYFKRIRKQKNYFAFTTDNKEYKCGFEPQNYPALINDLKSINSNLEIKFSETSLRDNPNVPINKIIEKKLGTDGLFAKITAKITSMNFVALFLSLLVAMIGFILFTIWLEDKINRH